MPDEQIVELMGNSGFSFIGTVQQLGASTMSDIPVSDHTAVVRVDQVLHAPPAFTHLAGATITVELDASASVPAVGEQVALFANAVAFGESIAVEEVGRVPLEDLQPHVSLAAMAPDALPFASLAAQAEAANLRTHADAADAAVVGRVVSLEKAGPMRFAEHDPDWWKATLDIDHVEKGDIQPGPLGVLYANSLDVQWRSSPKPKASQEGLWLLHATEGEQRDLAAYQIIDEVDFQPVQHLESIRGGEG